jgi:hypothetical protein
MRTLEYKEKWTRRKLESHVTRLPCRRRRRERLEWKIM